MLTHRSSPRAPRARLRWYLAGLVAYVTMIGLTGRPGWRNALGLAIGVYAVVQLAALATIGLAILLTLLAGRAIGLAVRYAAGSMPIARAIWVKHKNPPRRHRRAGTTGAEPGDSAKKSAAESSTASSPVTHDDSGLGERNRTNGR